MLLKEILDGWGNFAKDKLKLLNPEIKELAKKRMLVCNFCDIRSFAICNPTKSGINVITGELKFGCGCALPPKTLSPDSNCPLGKWNNL